MNKLTTIFRFGFANFGPTFVFYGVNHFHGLKAAILVSTIYSGAEMALKLARRQPVTSLFQFSAATTLLFGMIDLYSAQPFLLRYEAVVTNVVTGFFFAASLFGRRTVIEELTAERLAGRAVTPDLVAFFRGFTVLWTAYFFVKAAAYAWVANRYSLEEALVIRSSLGTASLYAMIFGSAAGGRRIFLFLKARGLLPGAPTAAAATAAATAVAIA